jgi:predicted Holliday junction resolvase-like endonuclease
METLLITILGGLVILLSLCLLMLQLSTAEKIKKSRKAAIVQSRAVLGGQFTEQLIPYLPDFKYDPTEARFIGSPIDFLVFPGLAKDNPMEVVFMEIKTGKSGRLTDRERKIRDLVLKGKVRWELLHYGRDQ